MLIESSKEVIYIKPIKVPFTYKIIEAQDRTYYKNYNIKVPFIIPKERLDTTTDLYIKHCTVIIKYYKILYWCPIFEEFLKNCKSTIAQRALIRNTNITVFKNRIEVRFIYNRRVYKTNEVKIIEAE